MIAGIAAIVKALKPRVKVIGVEPTGGRLVAARASCWRWRTAAGRLLLLVDCWTCT